MRAKKLLWSSSPYIFYGAVAILTLSLLMFIFLLGFVLIDSAKAAEIRSSNVEFNPLAIDEDRCPGVMIFPGTRSGSHNAYYYLVKPYPKMNIDFEDVAYVPSFKKEDSTRSFFYAIYFPSYNETNPFDEYADVPCSKDQLKREILKTIHASERPEDPDDINLSRLKINTLSFAIPQYYKNQGYELIFNEALSDPQNAGVLYSRNTFVIEIRLPESEFEHMLGILRSDIGFPLNIRMGFRAKEQLDYKEVFIDVGSLANELKLKFGAKSDYFSKAQVSSAIKTSSSFTNIDIYAETSNIDKWIDDVLIPLLSSYTISGQLPQNKYTTTNPQSPYQPPKPKTSKERRYTPPAPPNSKAEKGNEPPIELGKIYLDLSNEFSSDFKKVSFRSDVLNPDATQEYLVYEYPLRYYGEIDGNYFVLESNRYEESDRYSQIYLEPGETIEFTVEGYWEVSPKLVRQKYYFNKDHLDSGELPHVFKRNNPDYKIEESTGDIFVYGGPTPIPGFRLGGQSMNQYIKFGHVKIEPVSWGNGYFPKYFNWKPKFPASFEDNKYKSPGLTGTNLFDVKVPLNNLRPYDIEDLLAMIPLGVRLWKGKAVAISEIMKDTSSELYREITEKYFTIKFDHIRKTVMLTAVNGGHLYFENLDFVNPEVELLPKNNSGLNKAEDGSFRYITEDDFIKIDEMLARDIEVKHSDKMAIFSDGIPKNWMGLPKFKGELPESWKPLQYYYAQVFVPGLSRGLTGGRSILAEQIYPLRNPKIEIRTYIKLKIFDNN